ncbi:GyrI-like domain-containing protein [Deminuibacter soli]|uniref:GyrI-like small molecule binding domain-containing protein n=1 Tax=Deminuibacter soli TaxID=2291815 RepID=A0A3E1NQY4_9BACT|nr:GyrI-like domain-containing protein [Deminuibacter soli]RFM30346.1 hypothetical protein DXN05_05140 [Deminuibacter soli]
MQKTDFSKLYPAYYKASAKPALQRFNTCTHLSLAGEGDPGAQPFQYAIQTLYAAAFAVKQLYKSREEDFVVPKLEALWWTNSGKRGMDVQRSEWCWQLLIRMPDSLTQTMLTGVLNQVMAQKQLPMLRYVQLQHTHVGNCAQILHIGPYSAEQPTLDRLYAYIAARELETTGRHHEIYLSNPLKTAPHQLKTILRQPVKLTLEHG